jgi:hypothetical protein
MTSFEEATAHLESAMEDVRGDMGDELAEAGFWDMVINVARDIPDKATRFEFCRGHLGMIPQEVANW